MCNCQTWARLPEQGTHGGKFPAPNHHKDCEDYEELTYSEVEYDGIFCIMEPHEAAAMSDVDCEVEYHIRPILLTKDQFDRLGSFAGW